MSGVLFVLLALASYRIWRLVGKDDITQPARDVVFRETSGVVNRYLHDLITCSWCAGSWCSVASVYATHRWLVALHPHWLLWAVAVSAVVGFLGSIDDRLTE